MHQIKALWFQILLSFVSCLSSFFLKQIKNILAPGDADPHGHWHDCKNDVLKCSSNQLKIMQGLLIQSENKKKVLLVYLDVVVVF